MKLRSLALAWTAEESGAVAIEYASIASIMGIAMTVSLIALGAQLGTVFGEVSSAFDPQQLIAAPAPVPVQPFLALAVKGGGKQ